MRSLLLFLFLFSYSNAQERMSWLANGEIKLGVDLDLGGAIVYLAPAGGKNLINNFDYGRQVQLSFFSGPVPFEVEGQKPTKHWEHIGWNPIQVGDDFDNKSEVLNHENDGKTIRIACRPMQWPLNNIPGECIFETEISLDGQVAKVTARLKNNRSDHTLYPARLQELPAVYANAAFHRVVSYIGDQPFTGGDISEIPKSTTEHPWTSWLGTEGWAALLDKNDRGLGLITPGRIHFTGGFAGQPGPNETTANSTGYLASQRLEILDHNIEYEYDFQLLVGSLADIRSHAKQYQNKSLPEWHFTNSREGWHYRNATDTGWPVSDHLQIELDQNDPQLISPRFLISAEDAPFLEIEAAITSQHKTGAVFWYRHGEKTPSGPVSFPIQPDGKFRVYRIDLSAHADYTGAITGLRIDPVPGGGSGDMVQVRSVKFAK